MIVACSFIQRMKLRVTYTNDTRIASSNVTCHHEPRAWETSGGKQVVGNRHTRKPQACEGHATKCKKLNTLAKGQRAAHDI